MFDAEEETYNNLYGFFKHYCHDWDGLAIDEMCMEFEYCLCFSDMETLSLCLP